MSRLTGRVVTAYTTADGLAADNVYPIYEDKSGRIWIGSWMGLTVYEKGRFADVSARYGLAQTRVMSFLEASDGSFWIGNWDESVRRIRNGEIKVYAPDEFGAQVRAIIEDGEENVWFGTEKGLVRFKDEKLTKFTNRDGLGGNHVFVIFEDRGGHLRIGTEAGPLLTS